VRTGDELRRAFALVIAAQAAHSVEEYAMRLFDVFAPARAVSSVFGAGDLARGFAIANALIVLFGVWCYVFRVRTGHPSARGYAWFWCGLELANGVGHLLLAAAAGGYFPGAGTAPLLLASAAYLGWALRT
jgi:Protein of unknown function with HXXEE motif